MSLRLIASLMLSASIFFGSVPFSGFPGKDNPDGIVAFDGSFVPASYDSYEVTLADGGTVKMSLTGSKMILDPSDDRSFDITLSKCSNQKTVKSFFRGGDVFDIELASYMNDGEIYYLSLSYDAFGTSITNGNNIALISPRRYLNKPVSFNVIALVTTLNEVRIILSAITFCAYKRCSSFPRVDILPL